MRRRVYDVKKSHTHTQRGAALVREIGAKLGYICHYMCYVRKDVSALARRAYT